MPQKNLSQRIEEMDYPPEVRDAILNEIAKIGSEAKILSGESCLPSRQDAIHWHDRLTGRFGITDREKALEERVKKLEEQQAPVTHAKGVK